LSLFIDLALNFVDLVDHSVVVLSLFIDLALNFVDLVDHSVVVDLLMLLFSIVAELWRPAVTIKADSNNQG